jgi:hypothetical protein
MPTASAPTRRKIVGTQMVAFGNGSAQKRRQRRP